MAEQGIPGLAVALVDKDQVLWTEGFGHLDRDDSAPVTADTNLVVLTAFGWSSAGGLVPSHCGTSPSSWPAWR